MNLKQQWIFIPLLFLLFGCQVNRPFIHVDFENQKPHSILILPPHNMTAQQGVFSVLYPILTRQIGQLGYYVFSPEFVKEVFEQQNLYDAGRIHTIAPEKLKDIFGCDSVLYVEVKDWSSQYVVLSNFINITLNSKLVDAATSETFFEYEINYAYDTTQGQQGLGTLVMALASKLSEQNYYPQAATMAVSMSYNKLPKGLYDEKW